MKTGDSTYKIASVVYDDNICDQIDRNYLPGQTIPPRQRANRIRFTATVLDSSNNPPTTPQTVYWSCPQVIVHYSDKDGKILTPTETNDFVTVSTQTDTEKGEATIYACCDKPRLARISASLTPTSDGLFTVPVVFVTPGPSGYPIRNNPLLAPSGSTQFQAPNVYQDGPEHFYYKFGLTPNIGLDQNGLVAAWIAQIDKHKVVLDKALLFPSNDPVNGEGGPYMWSDLLANKLPVPYQSMEANNEPIFPFAINTGESALTIPNAVQFLYQEDAGSSDPKVSPWFSFTLTGAPWVQPNPNRPQNEEYIKPILFDPNTGLEEAAPPSGYISDDYFWYDTTHKTYWLQFNIHPDNLNPGDKIYPYIFANGFKYNTDQRISLHLQNGEYTVDHDKSLIKVLIPYNPLITIAEGIDNSYGQLDVIYVVNQIDWSPAFKAQTQFDPTSLNF